MTMLGRMVLRKAAVGVLHALVVQFLINDDDDDDVVVVSAGERCAPSLVEREALQPRGF